MIFYRLFQKVNPKSPEEPRKYYAVAKTTGMVDLRQLAEQISDRSTVSTMDTMAVLEGLLKVIPNFLLEGKIVKLGDFGTFRLSVSSEGTGNPDEFKVSMIKRTNLLFRAGSVFKNQLIQTKFTKASSDTIL